MIYFRPLLGNIASLVALILLFLCLFAGSSRQMLPDASILNIDTSTLSQDGAPDFISVYLMSYCYGYEKECIVNDDPKTITLQKSITACSDLNPLSIFDPGKAISDAIGNSRGNGNGGGSGDGDGNGNGDGNGDGDGNGNGDGNKNSDDDDNSDGNGNSGGADPKFPSYLTADFLALAPTSQAMALLFILGTCAVAISIFLRLSTIRYTWRSPGPPSPLDDSDPPPNYPGSPADLPPSNLQILSLVVSTALLTIGAIIATLISTQFVGLITKSGSPDFSADSGSGFLGMAWTAVGIQVLLTTDVWVALMRWKARHCRCDYDELPASQDPESKRLVSSSN